MHVAAINVLSSSKKFNFRIDCTKQRLISGTFAKLNFSQPHITISSFWWRCEQYHLQYNEYSLHHMIDIINIVLLGNETARSSQSQNIIIIGVLSNIEIR